MSMQIKIEITNPTDAVLKALGCPCEDDTTIEDNQWTEEEIQTLKNRQASNPLNVIVGPAPSVEVWNDEVVSEAAAEIPAPPEHLVQTAIKQTVTEAAEIFGSPELETGAELDADGVPWDGRIHGSGKGKRAKCGTWKPARGGDKEEYERITAELKAAHATPIKTADEVAAQYEAPTVPAPPNPGVEAVLTAATVREVITKGIMSMELDVNTVNGILHSHGVTGGLPQIANHPEAVPAIHAEVIALLP